ncbi:MAG: terpene cyclase/mutase family protein [Planctomycetes bacterium]|nr:terpene cyclase/mutase family protein [Planctomycetota bacterium]
MPVIQRPKVCYRPVVAGLLLWGMAGGLFANQEPVVSQRPDAAKLAAAQTRAVEFLRTTQSDDGSWTTNQTPGISGLVIAALMENGLTTDDATIQKGLKNLSSYVQPDGGIYSPKSDLRNYETCISLLAFHAANRDGRYDKVIAAARDFLKRLQWDETKDIKPDDVKFGGAGYGGTSRPDLSNTAYLLDALKAAGVGQDDPAMKNAVVFISRCQNLESEFNTLVSASKVNDGGFYYTPAAGGASPAKKDADDGLRSYGSMTYAGLKSMLYAGVGPDDPRVVAAVKWIRKYYSVTDNPGMGKAGMFYYYNLFAKGLDAMQLESLTDEKGVVHYWKKELGDQLISLQKPNGSWVNSEKRWMEGDPNLSTAFALLTLARCSRASQAAR